ncbi:ATP-binding protein [Sphingomonas sp. 3-13AW]|uniref:ATP-binding protein n=1 Tax=Sphingomonas sp. 3-13AW TaxID=3050450 RepID=UPI003BB77917
MQPDTEMDAAFVFGSFRLVPGRHVLLKGARPVKIGGRALALLHLLVMKAGTEVSKKELMEFAWPKVFVDDQNLKVHIRSLRRALEDTLPHPTYIATVVGRGYQFVSAVQVERVHAADLDHSYEQAEQSLPAAPHLIGRDGDVAAISRSLGETRLVTLVGAAGVGKTSLAVAVAHTWGAQFPDGVYYVDLTVTDDQAMVSHLIASSIGVRGDPGDVGTAIADHLRDRRSLIVLDNCEHVIAATAAFAQQMIDAKIRSCLLTTSREPLGVATEKLQRVEPLPFPASPGEMTASQVLEYPAVGLLAIRARESADYHLSEGDALVAAQLCKALDGIPLAIEVAAAQLDHFSLEQLHASIGRSLYAFPHRGGAHARHRTLQATLDWSYRLLSEEEATLFQLLSVFAGSFEWNDVTHMARLVQYDPYQTTTALGSLVAKSLLAADILDDRISYRLLESTKRYAAQVLSSAPISWNANRHHAQLVLAVFQQAAAEWRSTDSVAWRARYGPKVGDLRKALDWCFGDAGDASLGVDIAVAAIPLWNEQSSFVEQLLQVARALEQSPPGIDKAFQKAALAHARAYMMNLARAPRSETTRAWDRAVELAEQSGDLGRRLRAMFGKSVFLIYSGRNNEAVELIHQFLALAHAAGDRGSIHDGERLLALPEMHLGKLVQVRTKLEQLAEDLQQGVPPSRTTRYRQERSVSIHSTLTFSTWLTGHQDRAIVMMDAMVSTVDAVGGLHNIISLVALPIAFWSGDRDRVRQYLSTLERGPEGENIRLWEPVRRFYSAAAADSAEPSARISMMRSALDELVSDRILLRTPMYAGILAEALLNASRVAEARDAIATALALCEETQELWCRPELLRIRAAVLYALGRTAEAQAILAQAQGQALAMGAQTFALRILADLEKPQAADTGPAGGAHPPECSPGLRID